jgi:predicted transcriptional regulator
MPAQLKVYEMEKRDLIIEVQRLSRQEKLSNTQIKNLLNISYRRIRRYLSGDDAELLCRDGRSSHEVPSSVSLYHAKIVELIKEDVAYKEIYIKIKA